MEELVNLKTAPAHDLGVTGAHSDLQFLLSVCNVGVLHNNNKILHLPETLIPVLVLHPRFSNNESYSSI